MGSLNIEKKNVSYPPIYVYLCDWELGDGFLNKSTGCDKKVGKYIVINIKDFYSSKHTEEIF